METVDTAPLTSKNTVIGMIGLGDMGSAMATSIVRTFPLNAYDLRAEAVDRLVASGVRKAASLEALANSVDVVILVVLDDAQVEDVVGKLLKHPGKIHTIIISSTVLPSTAIALGDAARKLGIDMIDAAVTGGTEKASRGTITVLLGGDEGPVLRCWPLFKSFGKELFHLGPLGAGSAGKLVNNLLSLGNNILILEAMQLADAYGISEDKVTEFIVVSPGDSHGIRTWGRIDRQRRADPAAGSPIIYEKFAKDMKTAARAAGQRSVVLPVTAGIGAMIGEKMQARDKLLEELGSTDPLPHCTVCGQELAFPYRKAGMHPECAQGRAVG